MATREENLKKINDELKKLDDEQLEQVAGGMRIFKIDTRIEKDMNIDPTSNQNGLLVPRR